MGEGFVGGKVSGSLFITSGNVLKEKVGTLDIRREIEDPTNDEYSVLDENL